MIEDTRKLMERMGVDIDPVAEVSSLDTGKKQLLEIAKALHADAKLFILDEPTTALNNHETEHLFDIIAGLKAQGKSFIFISHKMKERFDLADRYTVLRNGKMISTGFISETNPEEVTRMMVGSSYSDQDIYESRKLGEPILELIDYTGEGFRNINLSIRRGEVVGFTGLKGAGVSELILVIFLAYLIINGKATTFDGVMNILRHSAVVGIISFGMGMVIITGGIDLSVGSMLALIGGMGVVVFNNSHSIALTLLVTLVIGLALGFFNGFLIGKVKMPPFIVTLATMLIYRSISQYYLRTLNLSIYSMDASTPSFEPMYKFGQMKVLGFISMAGSPPHTTTFPAADF